jgi:hypothetical protein
MKLYEWDFQKKNIAGYKQMEEDRSVTIGKGETLV